MKPEHVFAKHVFIIGDFCLPPSFQTPILFWPTTKQNNAPSPHVYADKAMPVPITITVEIEEEIPASSNTGRHRMLS